VAIAIRLIITITNRIITILTTITRRRIITRTTAVTTRTWTIWRHRRQCRRIKQP
jgi:hypothetical protein